MTHKTGTHIGIIILTTILVCSCANNSDPSIATPTLVLNQRTVIVGGPLKVTYRFSVEPRAPSLSTNYKVFVHFLDSNGELLWTDDHDPTVPTSQWNPGQILSYEKEIFLPMYPYIGEVTVTLGLYSVTINERLPLTGEHLGQNAYKVATFELLPQSEGIVLNYEDGWHPAEHQGDDTNSVWQWTKQEAAITFRNPKQESVFFLHYGGYLDSLGVKPPLITIMVGEQPVDSFVAESTEATLRKIPLSRNDLGRDEVTVLKIITDKTFRPADISEGGSQDDRELGLRIFHTFLQTQ